MTPRATPPAWLVWLRLGRVSNLPTVWSNGLAGSAIALDAVPPPVGALLAGLSCFYTGGMLLNDAFDAEHDRAARPERPIPSGLARRRAVLIAGFSMLAAGALLVAASAAPPARGVAAAWGAALAALILYYDWRHKRDRFSAGVMAACRALVYLVAGAAVGAPLSASLLGAAALLAAYVVVLSQIAKRDMLPGRGIAALIAGISLLDAALILAMTGQWRTAAVAALGFPLTMALQRVAPGT